jgi:predicted HTH domain antitoxin
MNKQKALLMYENGKVPLDKAAEIAGITVTEMMTEAAQRNLGSTETVNEFNESLKKLLD